MLTPIILLSIMPLLVALSILPVILVRFLDTLFMGFKNKGQLKKKNVGAVQLDVCKTQ